MSAKVKLRFGSCNMLPHIATHRPFNWVIKHSSNWFAHVQAHIHIGITFTYNRFGGWRALRFDVAYC